MSSTQAEIAELRREHGLDVLGLDGRDDLAAEHVLAEGVSVIGVLAGDVFDPAFLADGLGEAVEGSDAEDVRGALHDGSAVEAFGVAAVVDYGLDVVCHEEGQE